MCTILKVCNFIQKKAVLHCTCIYHHHNGISNFELRYINVEHQMSEATHEFTE